HFIQDMRKKAGLNIEDHIRLALYTDQELASVLPTYAREIMAETLAGNLLILGEPKAGKTTLLLNLTRDLLERASPGEKHALPVVSTPDNPLISGSLEQDKPSFEEIYRERIAPDSLKKLENYTIEVVLGRM